ncbi:MAG: type transport system permease protein, partial [Microbacteriaceae bacterium]|nr:type transport system permease protein [Microbacteriaceae bacterium]
MTASPFFAVAGAIARRNLKHAFKNPALLLPSVLFPLIFLVAFAGGLSGIGKVPGFDFPTGYTAFQFVFVFLQSACFGGLFTGFAIGADFESGFAQRLLVSAPERTGILAGYVISGLVRFAATGTVVTVAALLAGMQVDGSGVEVVGLVGLGVIINVIGTLWSTGL